MVGLARDFGDEFELGVIVEHGEAAGLGDGGDEGVDEREGPVPAAGGEGRLSLEGPPVVGVGRGHRRERQEAVDQHPVVGRAPGGVAETEDHRCAHGNVSVGGEGGEHGGHLRLDQASEHAGVSEVAGAHGLLVGSPRLLHTIEVEAALLAEQRHEFQPALGLHDLEQCGVDRRPQRLGAQDGGRRLLPGPTLVWELQANSLGDSKWST